MSCCGAFIMPVDLMPPPAQRPSAQPFRLTGRKMLAFMVAFFMVVAGVNAVMMTLAIRTMPGVEVKSAYETSQRFNGEIARMQSQAERGWQADARLLRAGPDAALTLSLRDRTGGPVAGLAIEARLEHPATRQQDHAETLRETAPGVYEAPLANVHGGSWTLAITALRGDDPVFTSRSRVVLKD
jgi:nitrogen fixation protein FixH